MSTSTPPATDGDAYEAVYHLYEPHKVGIPKLGTYFSELWKRREFAAESSKAGMRGANSMTFFGQAWLVINPLLLALVYYFLKDVLSGGNGKGFDAKGFSHLTGGLFVFYFFQGAVSSGASSVVGAGKLVLNTAFPRLLLPLSAVRTGFFRFLPTVPVYLIFHIIAGNPWNLATLIAAPFFLLLITIFASGLAAVFAALQVYFRDTNSFLPYVMRIWLYTSPVIWTIDEAKKHHILELLAPFNPLYPLIGGYGEALQDGVFPPPMLWVEGIAWAVVAALVGFGFFMSRERDFAVRI